MNVNISLVLSLLSLLLSFAVGVTGIRRSHRSDDRADSAQLTTVIVKLESIGKDVSEMKTDLRGVRDDVKNHGERIIKLEQQVKVLNHTVFREGSNE
ncbi:MAG: hypothetical protein MJ070_05995 [Lachnospiraceae bacterium]|nr:hypothetical protein [Lachnospiraceae bacterium]